MDSLIERNLIRQRALQNEEAKEQRNRAQIAALANLWGFHSSQPED